MDQLIGQSMSVQYDEIARRVLGLMGGHKRLQKYVGGEENIYVKIDTVYEPDAGYDSNEELQLTGHQVNFLWNGDEDGELVFDPNQTGVTDSVFNTELPLHVIGADFDVDNPQAVAEQYVDNIYKITYSAQKDVEGEYETRWIVDIGGAAPASTSGIYDFIITTATDGEPDRYTGDAYTNYYGRDYGPSDSNGSADFEDAVMLIEDAQGDTLEVDYIIKCVGYIEYHDAPIGSPPDPPDPLPDGYEDPPPPYATRIFRPINLWRYY